MENLVSGQNRLQGVLGGDVITFLKGILIKEIIKSVNIWKGDLTDQIVFLLVKTWASLNLQQIPVVYICTSDIDHMTIVKSCMISVKFWHQSRWTDRWCKLIWKTHCFMIRTSSLAKGLQSALLLYNIITGADLKHLASKDVIRTIQLHV